MPDVARLHFAMKLVRVMSGVSSSYVTMEDSLQVADSPVRTVNTQSSTLGFVSTSRSRKPGQAVQLDVNLAFGFYQAPFNGVAGDLPS